MAKDQKLKFEESILELEQIVENLEAGNLTIDSAIDEFKKGIELYNKCSKKIEETEGKVKLILKDQEGYFNETDFINVD